MLYLIFSIIPSISGFEKKYHLSLVWTLVIVGSLSQILKLYIDIGKLQNEIKDLKTEIDNKNNKISELTEKISDLKDEKQRQSIVKQTNLNNITVSGTPEAIASLITISSSTYSQVVPGNSVE